MQELLKYTGIGASILVPLIFILWFFPIVIAFLAGLFGFLLVSALFGMIVHGAWEQWKDYKETFNGR